MNNKRVVCCKMWSNGKITDDLECVISTVGIQEMLHLKKKMLIGYIEQFLRDITVQVVLQTSFQLCFDTRRR